MNCCCTKMAATLRQGKLSALTLGTWGIGGTGWGETSQSHSLAAIDRMLELGVNVVDTAPVYGFGNPGEQDFGFGCAELLLAKALKGRRDKVFLVTKCGLNYDRSKGPSSAYRSMSAQEIREGCENSLRRLGTDYLDLLLVHWPDGKTPLEEVAQAMEDLIRRGWIKYYGVSNFSVAAAVFTGQPPDRTNIANPARCRHWHNGVRRAGVWHPDRGIPHQA